MRILAVAFQLPFGRGRIGGHNCEALCEYCACGTEATRRYEPAKCCQDFEFPGMMPLGGVRRARV